MSKISIKDSYQDLLSNLDGLFALENTGSVKKLFKGKKILLKQVAIKQIISDMEIDLSDKNSSGTMTIFTQIYHDRGIDFLKRVLALDEISFTQGNTVLELCVRPGEFDISLPLVLEFASLIDFNGQIGTEGTVLLRALNNIDASIHLKHALDTMAIATGSEASMRLEHDLNDSKESKHSNKNQWGLIDLNKKVEGFPVFYKILELGVDCDVFNKILTISKPLDLSDKVLSSFSLLTFLNSKEEFIPYVPVLFNSPCVVKVSESDYDECISMTNKLEQTPFILLCDSEGEVIDSSTDVLGDGKDEASDV